MRTATRARFPRVFGAILVAIVVAIAAVVYNRFSSEIDKDGLGKALWSGQGIAFYLTVLFAVLVAARTEWLRGAKPVITEDDAEMRYLVNRGLKGLADWAEDQCRSGNPNALPTAVEALQKARSLQQKGRHK